ncbi:MAG: M1 family metallopeptidase [Nitrospira sp.]|nr:M1 family metallopeptidase [Nitrospira sp.]
MALGKYCVPAILTLFLIGPGMARGLAAQPVEARPLILSHELVVELFPGTHELLATDETVIEAPIETTRLAFTLAPSLRVESVTVLSSTGQSTSRPSDSTAAFTTELFAQQSRQRVLVTLPKAHGTRVKLAWTYRGFIDDPPKEPRHLRFVTPSETAGHVGPEGVYLGGESQWYPDIEGSYSTYRLTVQVPHGWTALTQGRQTESATTGTGTSSTWVVADRSEALTLVANRFTVTSREWTSRDGQRVELATYVFPDNAALADEYLDATAKYLDAYIPILGAFPFGKFAVVENFFASGLGMPSFTLLGSGSIKRHYVQPYALGHEIVHSWIGNSVFNRDGSGNWVEGLTTYLANYYWHELHHDDKQAIEQRRMMLQGYSVYVAPDQDYPVAQFVRKSDERDNAIGYQKSAFLFHLLRREIGDEAFWRALKTFVGRYRDRPADWESIETVFAQEARRDLRWFFEQWVERPGAPVLSLGEVHAHRVADKDGRNMWQLTVHVQQAGTPFRMALPVTIATTGTTETRWVSLNSSPETAAEFTVSDQPILVRLDPDLMGFRRLARSQLPPMLNGYVTDRNKTIVRVFADEASPLQQVIARVADQETSVPESRKTKVLSAAGEALPSTGSVLILAGADEARAVQQIVKQSCGNLVALRPTGFDINGRTYEGQEMAALFSCHRASVPGSILTVLYGVSPGAVANASRYLFYYGWQSYVIFKDGAAITRDVWQNQPETKEVRIDATQ